MIESEHFFAALHVLSEVLPYQKQLSPETRGALWELFPPEAKQDLTAADLQWAVSQRLIDPNPPREMAISFVFLHYLYPKRDGWPALDAGPRRRDPQTAVRDEQKVFRAWPVSPREGAAAGWLPGQVLPEPEKTRRFDALYVQQPRPDSPDLLQRTASAMMRTPMHPGGEGPDGPIPPIWSEPNWQGSGRHG
jgi:hypothetical protein